MRSILREKSGLSVAVLGLTVVLSAASAVAQTNACVVNSALNASFVANCSGSVCSFANQSSAPQGIAGQDWSFGDGAASTAVSPSHSYAASGLYVVQLIVRDSGGNVGAETKVVAIGSSAEALASDDEIYSDRGVPITITTAALLANDAPGVTFNAVVSQPAHGTLTGPAGGALQYTSAANFEGSDSFVYNVYSAWNPSGATILGEATVSISVLRAPPVAGPDEFELEQPDTIFITSAQLLQNDSAGAVFAGGDPPDHGTLQFVETLPDGHKKFLYTPEPDWAGVANFEYFISWDGAPPFETGNVYVTVTDRPTAAFTVNCVNRTCTVNPQSTGHNLQRWLWNWGDGTPTIEPTLPYPWASQTHTYSASGHYTITHTVYDDRGQTDSEQIEVLANTTPSAANETATTERDIAVTIPVLANDSDPDGDPLTIQNVTLSHTGAAYQIVPLLGSTWGIRLTPPDSFVGTLTVTYRVADNWGATSGLVTTLVTVTQWTSITDALGEQFFCVPNGYINISPATLLLNDFDADGDPLSIVSMDTKILMGTLDCETNPLWCEYRPPLNGAGVTLFKYTVTDPAGHRDTATVRIYVGFYGSSPTLRDDYFTTLRNVPKNFTIQEVVQNDTDPDGDTLTVILQTGPRDYGSVACSTPMYQCGYTPMAGFVGPDRFLYWASDTLNPQSSASINVLTLPPDPPVFDAREDVLFTAPNTARFFTKASLTTNDYDPQGDPRSISGVDTTGLNGSLVCDATSCTYTPPGSFSGTTKFKYTATDGNGSSDTAIVKIRVGGTNAAPVAVTDAFTTPKGTVLRFSIFDLLRNDYDLNNDPLNVTVFTSGANKGTLACGTPQYWCTYTPNKNVTGTDTINYTVADTSSTSSSFTITITP